jgi:hypothetical protein
MCSISGPIVPATDDDDDDDDDERVAVDGIMTGRQNTGPRRRPERTDRSNGRL